MSDDARWEAVRTRDARFDGAFVYGVLTTGVYCHPSCPSRRPLRDNVRFYSDAQAAEAAGFRACKRCGSTDALPDRIQQVCARIDAPGPRPTMRELATLAGLSEGHLRRVFRAATGSTPTQWARARQAARVRDALRAESSVTDAIWAAGYESTGRFYEQADDVLGMTPSRFAAGGDGTTLVWATGTTSLGRVLVAGSARGVCAVLLGEDDPALLGSLRDAFPRATLQAAPDDVAPRLHAVLHRVDTPGPVPLPLDLQGTAFQIRVWRALTEIPAGTTVSYADLADRIGRPRAVRAVAAACAANRIAVFVPCHRVVRSDGTLAGYRWGVERKRALLARERADAG